MILSSQDCLKPFIFRTKGEQSTKNFLRPIVHRKPYVPILLCRSDGFIDDYEENSSEILVSPSLVDNVIPSTKLVNANSVAKDIKNRISRKVRELEKVTGTVPVLEIVFVGQPKLKMFVDKLIGACCKTRIKYVVSELPKDHTSKELIHVLKDFNRDRSIHSIHVQIIDEEQTKYKVKLEKDIDGYQNQNFLELVTDGKEPNFLSPSPKGIA